MSKSKEGIERTDDKINSQPGSQAPGELDQRPGSLGESDYTAGRESYRDFPRRSTARRITIDDTALRDRESAAYRSYQPSRQRPSDEEDLRYRGRQSSAATRDEPAERTRDSYAHEAYAEDPYYHSAGGRRGYRSYPLSTREPDERYQSARGESNYRRRDVASEREYRSPDREPGYDRVVRDRSDYDADPKWRDDAYGGYFEPPFGGFPGYYARHEQGRRLDWENPPRERRRLRCADIMTKDVTVTSPQAFLREAANKMDDDDIGSLPVAENGRLVGLITDRDIVCRAVAMNKATRSTPVSEVMSHDIVTCSPDEPVTEAIQKMAEHQIRRLPICDVNGRLRGIVAIADIALEAERDQELADALEQISRPTPHRSRRI